MRDMTNSCATINVAVRYIICSKTQEGCDGETGIEKTQRARLEIGPPDHGAARPAGPSLDVADSVGTARKHPHLARAARSLRRCVADRAAGAAGRAAAGRLCRAGACERLPAHGNGQGSERHIFAATPVCRAMEGAD